jgi:hypothetical protein
MPDVSSRDFGLGVAQPERRYDLTRVCGPAGPYLASVDDATGVGVGKRAGSGGRVGTLAMKMASVALVLGVLTSCAGGGNIEVPESPTRSASLPPTPTVSVPTPTRSATRPEIPSPTPRDPSPAPSLSRPAEEPTRTEEPPRTEDPTGTEEPTATRSAETDPSGSPTRVETTTTQTVTAAPSPSTVTRLVTVSPSPSASPSPSSSAAAETAETSGDSWFWWALAGLLLAAAIATPLLVRAHRRRVWRADFATAEQDVAWFARVLVPELGQSGSLDQVEGGWTVGANRIAAVEDRLTVLEGSAPDDATRTATRTLRDAVRTSRGRVEGLLRSGDPEAIPLTLNEVAAGLEAALGPVDQAG